MRVLAVLLRQGMNDEIAGSERSFVELGNALVELGVEIDVIELPPSVSISIMSRLNHYTVDQSSRRPMILFHTLKTFRIALNRRSQVIFAPVVYWPELLLVALMTHLILRKPLFVGLPGPFLENEDRLELVDMIGQRLRGNRATRTILTAFLRRLVVRASSAVLVPSGPLASYARNTFGARKTVVIGRGVDDSWFEPESSTSAKIYDVIFVGRLDKGKGVETLLKAWKDVPISLTNGPLLVVGSGPLRKKLERLAQEMGLGNRVTFTGYVRDAKEVRKLLHSSRMLVLLSDGEGFARVVAEAMACGLPCVISEIPSLRELYSAAAVFVPRRDHVSLASAISELLLDDRRREELGRKSVALARTLRWSRAATLTLETFESAAHGNTGS